MLWYFFGKVAAVVFTEDLKRLYVTMKEGFPLEYIVCLLCFDFPFFSVLMLSTS